jgi:hypothetical protein
VVFLLEVFVSGHKFYVCNFRTKHKICILAYHNLCFCVVVFLGMLHFHDTKKCPHQSQQIDFDRLARPSKNDEYPSFVQARVLTY